MKKGGVLLYIKELIPAFVVQLQLEADCNEATRYKLVTRHTTFTIGVVYRCPNVTKPNNEKYIYATVYKRSEKRRLYYNRGIKRKWDITLQRTGVEDQQFFFSK